METGTFYFVTLLRSNVAILFSLVLFFIKSATAICNYAPPFSSCFHLVAFFHVYPAILIPLHLQAMPLPHLATFPVLEAPLRSYRDHYHQAASVRRKVYKLGGTTGNMFLPIIFCQSHLSNVPDRFVVAPCQSLLQ